MLGVAGYRWFYEGGRSPNLWLRRDGECVPHGIWNSKSWIFEDLGRRHEERDGCHRKMAFKKILPQASHVERGGKHSFLFLKETPGPLPYWKLHPLAVVWVKEAFMDRPKDLSNIFKRNIYGKMHLSFQQLIYKWLCRKQTLEGYFYNLSLKLTFSFYVSKSESWPCCEF